MVNPTQLFATVATVQESKHMDTQPAEPHHATTEEKLRAQLEQAMRDMGTMRLENEGPSRPLLHRLILPSFAVLARVCPRCSWRSNLVLNCPTRANCTRDAV